VSKRAMCNRCGGYNVSFDAYADVNGEVIHVFDTAFCGGDCAIEGEGEIKYDYTIEEEN